MEERFEKIGKILIIFSFISLLILIFLYYFVEYTFDKIALSYWKLADKSSTLEAKSYYIDKFVESLENLKFSEYNAIFFKTPNNNVRKNLETLKTLQNRLKKAKQMDVNSFEYQKAIEQITAQEQGEAKGMIDTIKGGWKLANYPLFWKPIFVFICCLISLIGVIGYVIYETYR